MSGASQAVPTYVFVVFVPVFAILGLATDLAWAPGRRLASALPIAMQVVLVLAALASSAYIAFLIGGGVSLL